TEAILSTRMPQKPTSNIGRVLCDADLYHLSSDTCTEKATQLRKEWETHGKGTVSDEEWLHQNIAFMAGHRYHTAYGQTVLQAGKKRNIRMLRRQLTPDFGEEEYQKLEDKFLKLQAKVEREK